MKPIVFHRKASEELDEAAAYYEDQRDGFGLDLLSEIEEATRRIQLYPKGFSPYKQTMFRKYVVRKFPDNLFYMELDESIWIAAVAHQKRRPDFWIRRKYSSKG